MSSRDIRDIDYVTADEEVMATTSRSSQERTVTLTLVIKIAQRTIMECYKFHSFSGENHNF